MAREKDSKPAAAAAGLKRSTDEVEAAAEARRARSQGARGLPADRRCPRCGLVKASARRWAAERGVCRSCAMVEDGAPSPSGRSRRPTQDVEVSWSSLLFADDYVHVDARAVRAARRELGLRACEVAARCGWSNAKQTGIECSSFSKKLPAEDFGKLLSALGGDPRIKTTMAVDEGWRAKSHAVTMARIQRGMSVRDAALRCGWEPSRQARVEDGRSRLTSTEAETLLRVLREERL